MPFPLAVLRGYFRGIYGTWFPPGHFPTIYFWGEVVILFKIPGDTTGKVAQIGEDAIQNSPVKKSCFGSSYFLIQSILITHMTQRLLCIQGARELSLCGILQ